MGISSIWDNSFYNISPQPKWLFEVDFESFLDKRDAEILSKAVINCHWGKREVSLIKTFFAGVEANFPGRVANAGELEIKFNENSALSVSNILENEYKKHVSDDSYFTSDSSSYSIEDTNKIEKVLIVKIINPNNSNNVFSLNTPDEKCSAIIEFHNCWLKNISEEEMDYESKDETVTRSATFSYDYMKFIKTSTDK